MDDADRLAGEHLNGVHFGSPDTDCQLCVDDAYADLANQQAQVEKEAYERWLNEHPDDR